MVALHARLLQTTKEASNRRKKKREGLLEPVEQPSEEVSSERMGGRIVGYLCKARPLILRVPKPHLDAMHGICAIRTAQYWQLPSLNSRSRRVRHAVCALYTPRRQY